MPQFPLIDSAIALRQIIFSDFYFVDDTLPRFGIIVPILAGEGSARKVLAVVQMEIDPLERFLPAVTKWVVPSPTAEVLLVHVEKGEVVYLNELRHKPGMAARFRMPITTENLPAAKAARGIQGNTEGIDYRGEPVLASIRTVPGTSWFLVTKVDAEEVYSRLKIRHFFVLLFGVFSVAMAGLLVVAASRKERMRSALREVEFQRDRQALVGHFEYLVRFAHDAIVLANESFRIMEANDRALEMFGYGQDEFLRLNLSDLQGNADGGSLKSLLSDLEHKDGSTFEMVCKRKQGTQFPAEISGRRLVIEGKPYYQGIIRDITERTHAAKERERLMDILESSLNEIYVFDSKSLVFEYVNRGALRNLGYTLEAMRSMTPLDLKPEFTPDAFRRMIAPLISKEREQLVFTTVHRRANGSLYPVEVHLQLKTLPQGDVFLAIINDISDRKLAEEELRASEAKYRMLHESMMDAFVRVDMDGRIIECNNAYQEMLGYSADELYALTYRELTPARWHSFEARIVEDQIISRGYSDVYEKEYRRKNGTIFPVELRAILLRDEAGNPANIWGIARDITERKRAQEILRQSEKRLREAQEMAHLGFWEWDVKTGEVEWSEEVFHIFGLDPNKFTPRIDSILALSPWPEDHHRDQELIQRAIESHQPGSYEQKFLRPDQSVGHYYSTFRGNYDQTGDLVSMVGTVLDITDRKRNEEKLSTSEARYRRLFESAKDGILILDADTGMIVDVNPFLIDMLGYSKEQFKGKTIWELGFFNDIIANREKFLELQRQEYVRYDDLPLKTADGRQVSVEFVSNVYLVDNVKVVQCNIRNITERRIAEAKIRGQLVELQRWHEVTLGREDRIQNLKHEVNELLVRLGDPVRYPSQDGPTSKAKPNDAT